MDEGHPGLRPVLYGRGDPAVVVDPDIAERHRVGGQGIIGLTGHQLPGAVVAGHGGRVVGEHTVAAFIFNASDVGVEVHVAPLGVGLLIGVRPAHAEPRRVRSGPQAVRPVVAEVFVVAHVVHDSQGHGLGREFVDVRRAGVVHGRDPQETGGEGRFGQTLVERPLEDVADDMVAVRVVDHDRQLDRYLGAGLDAVEGGCGRPQHQGPGMQFAVVQDDHEGGAVGIGSQAPGGGVGDRPRNVDFVLCLGIAGQGQVGNPAAAQAGGDGAILVVVKQVAAGEAAGSTWSP